MKDFFLIIRIDQRHTAAFKSGTAESAAIDSLRPIHNLIHCAQLIGTALIQMDGRITTLGYQLTKGLNIAFSPRFYPGLHTGGFPIKMLRTLSEILRQTILVLLKYL